jgi:DNA-binding FadR family transcriptional regulator
MERMGLVSRAEMELERMISLDLLPADRSLPSEQKLARCFGVSRATLREALLRLSARGLLVQHPGRKTRARVLDEAVTLESLSVALHAEPQTHPERWRLLEGFFALKREMTVELLALCCEQASEPDLRRLEEVCFALREAARWSEDSGSWAQHEFALLRLAAHAADRPGHFLLIQSLERSFWGMAGRVLPHMDAEAIQAWALCAFAALAEKDAQALRRELPALLRACDDRLLESLAPAGKAADTREAPPTVDAPPRDEPCVPEAAGGGLPDAAVPKLSDSRVARNSGSGADSAWSAGGLSTASRSDATEPSLARPPFHICSAQPCCLTGSLPASPTGGPQSEAPSSEACPELACAALGLDGPPGREENGGGPGPVPPVPSLQCTPCAAPLLMAESRPPWPRPWVHPWRAGVTAWRAPCSVSQPDDGSGPGDSPWVWKDDGWLTWKSSTCERRPDE